MLKKHILLFFFLSTLISLAQHHLKGTIEPSNSEIKWVMLYQIIDGKKLYVKNAKIKSSSFNFEMTKAQPAGMYRVVYGLNDAFFLDIIYNGEDISFVFNSDYPMETIAYSKSKENKLYQDYLQKTFSTQQYLDSIQIAYFTKSSPLTATLYREAYFELKDLQKEYENESSGMLAYSFIKATQRFNSKMAQETPKSYLSEIKENFFKYINFKDEALVNSSFLVDRTVDYVFHLNYSKDEKIQRDFFKQALSSVLAIDKKMSLQKDLIEVLIEEFVYLNETIMVNYIIESYYLKLPKDKQSVSYIEEIRAKIAVVIGAPAPDFEWGENKQLSALGIDKNFILVFWSTDCSHCKSTLPKIHQLLKDFQKFQVIAIALEEGDTDFKNIVPSFPGWEHVLGVGKWDNKIARLYNIEATPTYIVLSPEKKIIALPEHLQELKEVLLELK